MDFFPIVQKLIVDDYEKILIFDIGLILQTYDIYELPYY
jgi:hypothetical protein